MHGCDLTGRLRYREGPAHSVAAREGSDLAAHSAKRTLGVAHAAPGSPTTETTSMAKPVAPIPAPAILLEMSGFSSYTEYLARRLEPRLIHA